MKSLSVISINGRSYECERSSASIPRATDVITDESCFRALNLIDPPMQMQIDVKKAVPLSEFYSDSNTFILDRLVECEIVTLEFLGGDCTFTGSFLIGGVKQHKKGAISFSAVSSGKITMTEL